MMQPSIHPKMLIYRAQTALTESALVNDPLDVIFLVTA